MIAVIFSDSGTIAVITRILGEAKRPRAILKAIEREAQNRLKTHFLMKQKTQPNQLGGKRQNFWRGVRDAVQPGVIDDASKSVIISINHPAITQKVMGGTIRAKRGHMLSIPLEPEAYGRAPAVFERETGFKLFFLKTNNFALLVTNRNQHSKVFQVEYLLKQSVYQRPDPTALPPEKEFNDALVARGEAALARQNPNEETNV